MKRRTFLKFLSASSLATLKGLDLLSERTSGQFQSKTFQFAVDIPIAWQKYTSFDEIDKHFSEWGGQDPEYVPPLLVSAKHQEPTVQKNHEIQIYGLCPIQNAIDSEIDQEEANNLFYFVKEQFPVFYDFQLGHHVPELELPHFCATTRAKGSNGRCDEYARLILLHMREYPLFLMVSHPLNEDDSELRGILRSFRDTN